MRYFIKFLYLLIVLAVVSCNADDKCRKDKFVKLQVGIYHFVYNPTTLTNTVAALNVDSITVKGIGVDSILYKNRKSIHKITLPLNKQQYTNVNSAFEITFNNIKDTVLIIHENSDQYLSLECGCIKTHKIDTILITNHFLDSASITIHDVNTITSAKEHIKLYK